MVLVLFNKANKNSNGGAINVGVIRIKLSKFSKNNANSGGAITIKGISSKSKIYKCVFNKNTAKKIGGAIYINTVKMGLGTTNLINTVSVKKSRFKSNKAKFGAKIGKDLFPIKYYPKMDTKFSKKTKTLYIRFNFKIKKGKRWSMIDLSLLRTGNDIAVRKWIKGNTLYIKTTKLKNKEYYILGISPNAIKTNFGLSNSYTLGLRFST